MGSDVERAPAMQSRVHTAVAVLVSGLNRGQVRAAAMQVRLLELLGYELWVMYQRMQTAVVCAVWGEEDFARCFFHGIAYFLSIYVVVVV